MKILIGGLCLFIYSQSLLALDNWNFTSKIAVTGAASAGVYHHLEGAGRKHIAVSGKSVAVVWEDNHSGDPQIYWSSSQLPAVEFTAESQVSNGDEAYEPAIAAIQNGGFIIAWEQDGAVYTRTFQQHFSAIIKLSSHSAGQVSLASMDQHIFAVWREHQGREWSLQVAKLGLDASSKPKVLSTNQLISGSETPVLFPTLAVNDSGLMVAWEDRQAGHTRLKYSASSDQGRVFSEPQFLNEFFSNRNKYDKGSGVTRVSMAAVGADEFIAAWMDKRRGGTGYGIFAALGSEGSFGPNEKVHSEEGDKLPHYNPSTSGNSAGNFVIAWDDFRHGSSDIWLSGYDENDEWSTDYSPLPASGKGEQKNASIFLDSNNGLHLLWVERENINGPTRLWYSFANSH